MLRVKVKIGPSTINGIGLFANQFIPKGTTTWQYDPEFDTAFDENVLERLPNIQAREDFLKYSYYDHNLKKNILCSDNQRFINHSKKPNVESTPEKDVAMRDIQIGEEILSDYTQFESDWFERRKSKQEIFKLTSDDLVF